MKIILCVCFLFAVQFAKAQLQYTVTKDTANPAVKVLTGTIDKYLLKNDSAFNKWYLPNSNAYTPDTAVLAALKKSNTQKLQFVLFGGTWCEDSQFILPRFFKLQEAGGVPDDNITFFGVNRKKKTLGHIAEAFGIINVPTIIVMKNGKELGRVVEYGKTGKWDNELAAIINDNN